MDEILDQRKQIDKIDDEIMKLLDKRFFYTNKIGLIKKASNTIVLDKNRQKSIFDKTSKYSHFPEIKSIYEAIMYESRKSQRK